MGPQSSALAVTLLLSFAPAQETPGREPTNPSTPDPAAPFDMAGRRDAHWCWQPIEAPIPPQVRQKTWGHTALDDFILAPIEAAHLDPNGDADPRTWLRRVTFDLTGLPPTPEASQTFAESADPAAYERAVDRLLASPRFGEHWARHWLDLVRYAESLGHEFDFDLPEAWRYRDYVVRALNHDVPYDQWILEHLAGDLLPAEQQRVDPATGANESIVGTAFWWLGEQTHAPVDPKRHTADRVDNQLDVLTKAFQGLTVSCARCHDHKFDAISQADYYALSGYLKSSRYDYGELYPLDDSLGQQLKWDGAFLAHRTVGTMASQLQGLEDTLATAIADIDHPLLVGADIRDPNHLLFGALLAREADAQGTDPQRIAAAWDARRNAREELTATATAPFSPEDWFATGSAFADSSPSGMWWDDGANRPRHTPSSWRHSGRRSTALGGSLQSVDWTLDRRYVHVLAAGREARINLIVEGFHLVRNPIYGAAKAFVNDPSPRWYTLDTVLWQGHTVHLAAVDRTTPDLADQTRRNGYGDHGWIAIGNVLVSDDPTPPSINRTLGLHPPSLLATAPAGAEPPEPTTSAGAAVAKWMAQAAGRALANPTAATPTEKAWLDLCLSRDFLRVPDDEPMQRQLALRRELTSQLPDPAVVPALADGPGIDQAQLDRGDTDKPLAPVPRRYLEALDDAARPDPVAPGQGSGRLALARRMASPTNPLTARVAINRVWHHLFGHGLVRTVDNFGVLGDLPSHPELLDYLALEFATDGWSLKRAIRRMVLSRTYRMDSAPQTAGTELDPENRLWHRMPVRRLGGEALRDAILSVSGRLDDTMGGPGVPVHLTEFMTGRGMPKGGPVDGDGRRSIYIQVRRNFLSPWMLAFDTPQPFSTVGRRSRSNVPAQPLALLNDPLVRGQAALWAQRESAEPASGPQRIARMFERALSRPPTAAEASALLDYLSDPNDVAAWTDVAHALFALKEFAWIH